MSRMESELAVQDPQSTQAAWSVPQISKHCIKCLRAAAPNGLCSTAVCLSSNHRCCHLNLRVSDKYILRANAERVVAGCCAHFRKFLYGRPILHSARAPRQTPIINRPHETDIQHSDLRLRQKAVNRCCCMVQTSYRDAKPRKCRDH